MKQIVLDIETKRGFDEVGGRENFKDLGVSLVGIYRYDTEDYVSYEEKDLVQLGLLLSSAERIIGFNIRRFDFPVLQPYFKDLKLEKLPMLDLLEEVEHRVGHRVSLESVSQATLGIGKSGKGTDAIVYYRNGEIEKLKKYCLDDVRLTKEIFEFGKRWSKIYFLSRDRMGKIEVPVDWRDPDPPSNLSLF